MICCEHIVSWATAERVKAHNSERFAAVLAIQKVNQSIQSLIKAYKKR